MSPDITLDQRLALQQVSPILPPGSYLAGGVAVALQCHHRLSRDLDLFVPTDFDTATLAERVGAELSQARLVGVAEGTVELELRGTPTTILRYRYPLLRAPTNEGQVAVSVASAEDLVCMKLAALADRGAARDFWDVHELLSQGLGADSLSAALALYEAKYAAADIGHVVRSLAYYADAEAAPLPVGLDPVKWARVKVDLARWVRALD